MAELINTTPFKQGWVPLPLPMLAFIQFALEYRYSSRDNSGRYNSYLHPVDINGIRKLTFKWNKYTNSRRGDIHKQLVPRRPFSSVDQVTCSNANAFTLKDAQWKCTSADPNVKIVNYEIQCEGWDSDDDYMVVDGSCWLKFDTIIDKKTNSYRSQWDNSVYRQFERNWRILNRFFDNGMFRWDYNGDFLPVPLSALDVLVFEKGKHTTSRKGQHYLQLQPLPGNDYEPDQIVCSNIGSDRQAPVWKCRTPLSKEYEFTKAEVSCEGWNGPGDSMIVPGSCLLEYKIQEKKKSIFDWVFDEIFH